LGSEFFDAGIGWYFLAEPLQIAVAGASSNVRIRNGPRFPRSQPRSGDIIRGKVIMRRLLIAVILALPAAGPLDCQPRRLEPIQVSGKKALVIANDHYRVSPLVNPPRDARSMDGVLREIGFTVTTKFNLTQRAMEETVDTFAASVRPGDLALVYYSGHGMQIDGENYLNPIDLEVRDETDAKYGSYAVGRLREKLEKSGAKLRILILDACRDNPFRRGTRGGPVGLGGVQSAATGTYIAYATGDNSVADDNASGSNGLFTGHLVSALREPGLTLDEVFEEVKEGVYVDSKQRQSPYTYSNVIGRFYFRAASAPAPLPVPTPAPAKISAPDSTSRRDRLIEAEREVEQLEVALTSLRQKFAENYPDVQSVVDRLAVAKQKRDDLRKEEAGIAAGSLSTSGPTPAPLDAGTKQAIGNLGLQRFPIATNASELAALKADSNSNRTYIEFTLSKIRVGPVPTVRPPEPQQVADIGLVLVSADPKRNRFTLRVICDDKTTEKRDRTINEPVQFFTLRSHEPYELVINEVKKDSVTGYLSRPK
jgi:uncharacterized caspase-like protein